VRRGDPLRGGGHHRQVRGGRQPAPHLRHHPVDRDGHKAIVIGKGGEKLKTISTQARLDMERAFDSKVYLEVWVKVKGGWADDVRMLKTLGID